MALRALIYLSALGPAGLCEVATLCAKKARYLADRLVERTDWKLAFPGVPFFKEFCVRLPSGVKATDVIERLEPEGIFPGVALSRFGFADDLLLIAVTEKRTREELDRLSLQCAVCRGQKE